MPQPIDMSRWTGRVDADEGPRALRWHQAVQPLEAASEPGFALLGFACDEGVRRNQGRAGARKGPTALRQALAGLAWHQPRRLYDAGDVVCQGENLEEAQAEYAARLSALLSAGHFPIGLGGGHEIAYGSFLGLSQSASRQVPFPSIGIVNLDAHFDLRQATQSNSGTSFLRIAELCRTQGMPFHYCCLGIAEPSNTAALFDRARELGVRWRTDEQLGHLHLREALAELRAFAAQVDSLYLTLCLDVLPAGIAPGVSAPAARGVPLETIETLVQAVKESGKLAVADIAELNPTFDPDQRTAKVAARLVYQITR
jgi:formiminoglutamase